MSTQYSTSPLANITNSSTSTVEIGQFESMNSDDAAWALTCAFLILTMQTGFAMLEGGCVSNKNMANIMVKNVCDVSIGGIAYWMFGYGLTYGKPCNPFVGYGDFFFNEENISIMGSRFAHYFFQFSFASTATTIVSGAVAERMKLHAYMIFSFVNIVIYSVPACWCWADQGFLRSLQFYDFAGVCVVHLNGGTSSIVASWMLGPRLNRFEQPNLFEMSSPVTALTGMFMLTWAWLGFNCGSTFGVTDVKWKISAVVAVCTLNGAIGGGLVGLLLSMLHHKGQIRVDYVINSILGGLVSVTGVCSVTTTYEALCVGAIGAMVAIYLSIFLEKIKLDDPVGAIPVHFGAALWGTLAVGIFGKDNVGGNLMGRNGLLHKGGFRLLGVNALGALAVSGWSAFWTFFMLMLIDKVLGIRMNKEEEYLGADYIEHNVRSYRLSDRLNEMMGSMDENRIAMVVARLFDEVDADDAVAKRKSIDNATLYLARSSTTAKHRPSSPHFNGFVSIPAVSSVAGELPNVPGSKPIRTITRTDTREWHAANSQLTNRSARMKSQRSDVSTVVRNQLRTRSALSRMRRAVAPSLISSSNGLISDSSGVSARPTENGTARDRGAERGSAQEHETSPFSVTPRNLEDGKF